jgi:orotate phosphoribosyltransferase
MQEVVEHLYNKELNGKVLIDDEMKKKIEEYYKIYGVLKNV